MKRLFAILFLAILLFNLQGYQLLIHYWQVEQEGDFETKLSKNDFETDDLISIKVPVTLPYYTNSANYDFTNGEVEMNGTSYKYIKKRIYNDSIEFVCIANTGKMRLENARDEFFKLCNDLTAAKDQNKKSPTHLNVKPLAFDYFEPLKDISLFRPVIQTTTFFKYVSSHYSFTAYFDLDQPPKVA